MPLNADFWAEAAVTCGPYVGDLTFQPLSGTLQSCGGGQLTLSWNMGSSSLFALNVGVDASMHVTTNVISINAKIGGTLANFQTNGISYHNSMSGESLLTGVADGASGAGHGAISFTLRLEVVNDVATLKYNGTLVTGTVFNAGGDVMAPYSMSLPRSGPPEIFYQSFESFSSGWTSHEHFPMVAVLTTNAPPVAPASFFWTDFALTEELVAP